MAKITIKGTTKVHEFDSIWDFCKYINDKQENFVFKGKRLLSKRQGDTSFRGTNSYKEAYDLMIHGWDVGAKELNEKLKGEFKRRDFGTRYKSKYDVVGGQVSVPRHLQGIPTSMIRQTRIPKKTKIISICKPITYNAITDKDDMMRWGKNSLLIIKKLESMGFRVNLFTIEGSNCDGETIVGKIKIKSSSERLNISKIAFMIAHPSMLRRISIRYTEVSELVTKRNWTNGYGSAISESHYVRILESINDRSYVLPKRIEDWHLEGKKLDELVDKIISNYQN